ncbi:MAG: transporter [Rhizomicrobium sp.]
MTLNVDLLEATYITDWHPLGGTYAFGGAIGYAWAGLDASIVTPLGTVFASPNTADLADSLIIPALIGWHDGNFHWSTALYIYAPTGPYHDGQLSTGKNIWGFMPQFAITYFDPQSGWEASAAFTYVTMAANDVTQYASGDILHLDWGVGPAFRPWLGSGHRRQRRAAARSPTTAAAPRSARSRRKAWASGRRSPTAPTGATRRSASPRNGSTTSPPPTRSKATW